MSSIPGVRIWAVTWEVSQLQVHQHAKNGVWRVAMSCLPQEPFPTDPSLELPPWPLLTDSLAINTWALSASSAVKWAHILHPRAFLISFMYCTDLCIPQQTGFKLSQHLLTISRWKGSDCHRDFRKCGTGRWALRIYGVCCIWLAHASRQLSIVQRAGGDSQ